jgi:hypothetical protein
MLAYSQSNTWVRGFSALPCSQIIRETISRGLRHPSSLLTDYQRSNFERVATSLLTDYQRSNFQRVATSLLTDYQSTSWQRVATSLLSDYQSTICQRFATSLLTDYQSNTCQRVATSLLTDYQSNTCQRVATSLPKRLSVFGTDPDRNRVTWETPSSEAIPFRRKPLRRMRLLRDPAQTQV